MGTGRHRRLALAVAGAAVIAAACSADTAVESESAVPIDSVAPTTWAEAGDPAPDTGPSDTSSQGTVEPEPMPDALPPLSTPDPATLSGTLDNGLRYLVRQNDNPGAKAELRLVVDAGSVQEDDFQRGAAHFLEHMLFNGTARFPKNELIDVLRGFGAGFGADINARTSRDETVYMLTVPSDDDVVETGLDILEDWLSAATLASDDVEAERGIVLDEWRSRSQTATGRVAERFADFMLDGTAYADRSPIGGRKPIESLTPDALRRFYDEWYRPDNAAVIVVGDIDPEAVEAWIVDRFSDAESRGSDPARPEVPIDEADDTRVAVVDDPELAEGSLRVALPLARAEIDRRRNEIEVHQRRSILDDLAFDVIATRLENDALRDDAPFERARAGSAPFARRLDAPLIEVEVDGAGVDASIEAIVDEFERVQRFGITEDELGRAVAVRRSAAERLFDGRGSRQDASFAGEYVRHVLEGEFYVAAEQEFAFTMAVLDAATPESVVDVFVDRYRRAGVEVFAAVRSAEAGSVAAPDELIALIDDAPDRELEPRTEESAIGDQLMVRPAPAVEVGRTALADQYSTELLDPTVIEFDNGVRVALNTTPIVEGQVFFEARSPGGLAAVDDADVADAQALTSVVDESGFGEFDRVALDTFLDDKTVAFQPSVDPFTDSMLGSAATGDVEVLLQLVNLMMTAPRADEVAVARYVDDQLPFAEDPSIDAAYARTAAVLEARYDDPRFLRPTPDTLATVDAAGIERVATQRFGDAADWSFALSGDFDLDEVIGLASAYLGTLPPGSIRDVLNFTEPPPPSGETAVEVVAGQGDVASVSFLYTGKATADRRDDILARVVSEVVGNRLRDVVREELGDSYSPVATVEVGGGATPFVETFITVSTAPDLVDEVAAAVLDELDSLRADGPTEREFDSAVAAIGEQLNFVNNVQINDEILGVLVDPAGNRSFDEFVAQSLELREIDAADVRVAIEKWIPRSDYIEVTVAPTG